MRAACSQARLAERRLERLPRRGVHLARGLVRERVDDDLAGRSATRSAARVGPVCTRNSRSLSVASDRSSDGIGCPSMLREHRELDRIAEHRGRLQRRAVLVARRATRDATRPAQRLRQRELLPDELHRRRRCRRRPSPRPRRRSPLTTSSMNSGCPPARVAHEAHRARRAPCRRRGAARRGARRPAARGPPSSIAT